MSLSWTHEPIGRECQNVVLIYDASLDARVDDRGLIHQEEQSVKRCLSDPEHSRFTLYRYNEPFDTVDITVELAPPYLTTKTMFVKITGRRSDFRSRSASPSRTRSDSRNSRTSRRESDRRDEVEWIKRDVPRQITIDSVPSHRRMGHRPECWARVRDEQLGFENIARRAWESTNMIIRYITTVDLSPRIPEEDVRL